MKKNSYKKVNGKNEWIVEELRGLKYNNPFFHHSKRWKSWAKKQLNRTFRRKSQSLTRNLYNREE